MINTLLSVLKPVLNRTLLNRLTVITEGLLSMQGRVTMLSISRWTYQRWQLSYDSTVFSSCDSLVLFHVGIDRIRKVGGGRKRYWVSNPEIDEQFLSVLCDHIAGDPMNEKIRWTTLRGWEIVEVLKNEYDNNIQGGGFTRRSAGNQAVDTVLNLKFYQVDELFFINPAFRHGG